MAILKKQKGEKYPWGYHWEKYHFPKNPSDEQWGLFYYDDEYDMDTEMAHIIKRETGYVVEYRREINMFSTLTDAKRWAESKVIGMGDYLTKPRSVKKTATKKRTVKRK